eukprot:TRINITY_DN6589_c0_g1_i1.p1 TRINITY_DN6589_c0_g1~~TRINITY_DN6589_c0_g1_i1.p1  ORF type:complete len:279 (+),score=36.37 TRINITY_DN6589_c0_g1_i1:61-837(+)
MCIRDRFQGTYRRLLWIGMFMAVFSQLVGINAVIFYSNEIFKGGKTDDEVEHRTATIMTIVVGIINLLGAIVSGLILDKAGRRTIMIIGVGVITISWGGILWALGRDDNDTVVFFVFLFIAAFGMSFGPVFWVYVSEILPSKGVSLAVLVNWVATLLVAQLFPLSVAHWLGLYWTFMVFFVSSIVTLVYIILVLPETRGISQVELMAIMEKEQRRETTGGKNGYGALDTREPAAAQRHGSELEPKITVWTILFLLHEL